MEQGSNGWNNDEPEKTEYRQITESGEISLGFGVLIIVGHPGETENNNKKND